MKKSNRIVLAVLADTHAGHQVGLFNPETILYRENPITKRLEHWTPNPTPIQELLWRDFNSHLDGLNDIADGSPVFIIHDGDLLEGYHYPAQLVSQVPEDQYRIAFHNLYRLAEKVQNLQRIDIQGGTSVHVGLYSSGEAGVAHRLGLALRQDGFQTDVKFNYHSAFTYLDWLVDVAHHGPPPGIREWLRGNLARYYLRDAQLKHIYDGAPVPDLFIRAHYHIPIREWLETGGACSWLINCASYKFIDEHTRKVAGSPHTVSVGMFAIELETVGTFGKFPPRVHKLTTKYDVRNHERII